ncbi:putative bifunctional diguanylate cyclase/phosphodiesterase [Pseudomonas saliphila]|uniref:putative bifunctional diguanylate cyclase/phosphodiesterase n=1 Tax=Pseudomonas saliphila TaxID=2586906 RepID=UPI00123B7078|nr:EAL domain-containing protein [Pseudomonas saliphila]
MDALRKNIWLLFLLLVLSSTVLLISISVSRWNSLTEYYRVSQQGLAAQWFGAFSSILEQQEVILSLMGEDLLLRGADRPEDLRARLDDLMNLNPDFFSGFALISPQGEVLERTSNLDSDVTNILDAPEVRDSFAYALETDKMVLGRTYLTPRLVVPARKAIRNNQGEVIGVMTGALSVTGADGYFSQGHVLGRFNRVTILRSRDHYIQYATSDALVKNFHEQPMPPSAYGNLMQILQDVSEPASSGARSGLTSTAFRWDAGEERGMVRGVAIYHPRYEFWLISEIEDAFLIREFLEIFASYLLVLLAFTVSMYLLFRYIDRIEKGRRRELIFQANHDALTRLPNRNYLISTFDEWMHEKPAFSLLFIDLDSFKGINDNFGHSIGDGILVELAKRFRANTSHNELLVRHGGDEFVFLTAGSDRDQNEQRAAALIYQACDNIRAFNMTFSPGCSIGIARFPEHGAQLDELLRASDIAMYEAKKKRNSVASFRPSLEDHYLQRIRIEQLLRGAEERGEIYMTYQPQIDAAGQLHGVEALVRWRHPELGLIPPDQFIGVAEQSGGMGKLGNYIIDQSLGQIQTLCQRYKMQFKLSINISVRQFAEADFAEDFLKKLKNVGMPVHAVCLEITENLLIEDLEHFRGVLQTLHSAGVRIALDDFGTGYSSLSILRDLPIDELKIDKSFVSNIMSDDTSLKMVKNIINIGRIYEMAILAEGVETEAQRQILTDCGCDLFQGYLFARPMAIDALEKYIQDEASKPGPNVSIHSTT